MKKIIVIAALLCAVGARAQERIESVAVYGKGSAQQLREGGFAVGAVQISDALKISSTDLNHIIARTSGVHLREEGGAGSEFDLAINGLSGGAVRWFVDGVPLASMGEGMSPAVIPTSMIERVEVYRGVVPAYLGADALGGAVNIVTRRGVRNHLDFSYSLGSFHTHKATLNARFDHRGVIFSPTVALDYSRNDYTMRGVEVWDEASRRFVEVDRRRFHDGYRSALARLEVGVVKRRWADEFFVSGGWSGFGKGLQTGSVQSFVIGAAERRGEAWSAAARYDKRWGRLRLTASASHAWDRSATVDTTMRKYDWNGDWIASSRNEITGRAPSLRHFRRQTTIVRAAADYRFNENHTLGANYLINRTGNERWDDADASFEPSRDAMTRHILAIAHNLNLKKFAGSLFIKEYVNRLTIRQTDLPTITGSREAAGRSTKAFTGYGAAGRYAFAEQFAVKASYEHTTRLPSARELLGNGSTVYANVALRPESSHNLNAGVFGTWRPAEGHTLYYEAGGFVRLVDDYISARVSEKEGMLQYENVAAVHITGVEGEVRYNWTDRLHLAANASWMDARDRGRLKTDGTPSATFRNRVPNQPWMMAGGEASYGLFGGALRLGMAYRWVHWYFLTWEAYGLAASKARIPTQHIVDLSATCSWRIYSIALQCSNVFDERAYDNYKLQKPGRALTVKLTISL